RELPGRIRRIGGRRLVTTGDQPQAVAMVEQAVQQRYVALARDAECQLAPMQHELVGEQLPACPHSAPSDSSTNTVYCWDLGFEASSSRTYRIELCPRRRAGSTMQRTNAVGSVSDAAANTGSGPGSNHASNGPYRLEEPAVSMRIEPCSSTRT